MAGIVKILDLNGLSYLYTKLRNEIDDFQATSKTEIDAAIASANAAAESANNIVNNAGNTYLGINATAAAATKLATARTINISGAVAGSATFDGSGDITINTTVQAGTAAPSSLANGSIYCVYE